MNRTTDDLRHAIDALAADADTVIATAGHIAPSDIGPITERLIRVVTAVRTVADRCGSGARADIGGSMTTDVHVTAVLAHAVRLGEALECLAEHGRARY